MNMQAVMKITTRSEIEPTVLHRIRGRGSQFFFERAKLLEEFVRALRFFFVDPADGKADMHHHVITDLCLRDKAQCHLARDTAKLHLAYFHAADTFLRQDFARNRETHTRSP